jgi:probable phosphoglycerate mutase
VDTDGQVRDTVAVNPPLTRLGELQAAALANRLSRADITRVYSSPAIRCLQTAQKIVAATGVAGEAGRTWEDWDRRPERVEETFPGIATGSGPTEEEWGLARAEAGARLFAPPAQALRARAARVLATIWAAHPRTSDGRICLVTHSGLGGYGLLPEMLASPAADSPRFVLAHASLSAVRCDGRGHLALRVNCTRHLVGLTAVLCADQTCAHQSCIPVGREARRRPGA